MKPRRWSRLALSCLFVLIAVGVAGFWFHTSGAPEVFGKYSRGYFLAAAGITALGAGMAFVAWLLVTPQTIRLRSGPRVVPLQTKLLVALVLAVLGFVVAEVALTRWEHQRLGLRRNITEYHPYLQNVPVPGDVEHHINRWGFRSEDIEKAKPPNTYRVFVLGGSSVHCLEVDFEYTFCRVLEKQLRQAYPHVRIEVQNGGAPAHTLQHSLIRFLFYIQDFSPDLIVSLQGYNDLVRTHVPPYVAIREFQPDYSHFLGLTSRMYHEYAEADSGVKSETVRQLAKQFRDRWFSDIRHTQKPVPPIVVIPFSDWKSLPCYARNCRDLITILRSKQIELVMASQPTLYQQELSGEEFARLSGPRNFPLNDRMEVPDLLSLTRGFEVFNETARAIAREHGAVFVDLDRRVPKKVKYFTDEVHFTEVGNQVVADAFYEAILAQGFVDKKFPRPAASLPPSR